MMKKKTAIIAIILSFLLGAGGMAAGFSVFDLQNAEGYKKVSDKEYSNLKAFEKKYTKLEQLNQTINQYYYKPVEQKELEIGMYKGLFWGIGDLYSSYMTKEEYESVKIAVTGKLQGVGVTIGIGETGNVTVVNPIQGSPAFKAGIKAGDMILAVDGRTYAGTELEQCSAALRGAPGTKVKVLYSSEGKKEEVTLVRANITIKSVESEMLDGKIGYIKILSFETETASDFAKELRDMEVKGLDGLIIDIRNNGGGIVEAGVEISDLLLDEGTVVYTEDKDGTKKYYKSKPGKTNLPYILLVNGASASTSEILAAAIKENQGGKVLGQKTFGKGIIQTMIDLPDGDAIKLTVMQYFSPKGNIIHEKGVTPDILVELKKDDETDYQLEKALEILKK